MRAAVNYAVRHRIGRARQPARKARKTSRHEFFAVECAARKFV